MRHREDKSSIVDVVLITVKFDILIIVKFEFQVTIITVQKLDILSQIYYLIKKYSYLTNMPLS